MCLEEADLEFDPRTMICLDCKFSIVWICWPVVSRVCALEKDART